MKVSEPVPLHAAHSDLSLEPPTVRYGSNLRIRERQFAPILLFCKKPDDLGER